MANVFKFGKLQITTSDDWLNITHEIEQRDPPFSLARLKGIGAIQFSAAEYQGGKRPEISVHVLTKLLVDFAQSRELGRGFDAYRRERAPFISAASFESDEAFWRVCYCSDGQNVALVTYNCERGQERAELSDCEAIVCNLKFEL